MTRNEKRLKKWEEELRTNSHGLAWAAPQAIQKLKGIVPWEGSFGDVVGAGARIVNWGKVPKCK